MPKEAGKTSWKALLPGDSMGCREERRRIPEFPVRSMVKSSGKLVELAVP
jgi:hypothetical protein